MTRCLGVDPGLSGALALVAGGRLLDVFDMPTLALARGGKAKREIDHYQLGRMLGALGPIDLAVVEQVGAMPGQGVSSVFAFGRAFGVVIGALAALDVSIEFVPPARWKREMGVPAAKDGARARASALLPHAAGHWARAKDDGRAEAAMLALYGERLLAARRVAA